jgi:transcriptional regulator with XRE-family HTH domain
MLATQSGINQSIQISDSTNTVSEFDAVTQSKVEIIQEQILGILHSLQSLVQTLEGGKGVAALDECTEHIQKGLRSITTDFLDENEITGPINWNLFGKCLRKRRCDARLTQKEVGARVGVTDTFIRYIEGAEKRPSRKILFRLLAIPELKLKVSDVTQRSANGRDVAWVLNSWLSPRYDPVQMMSEMTDILSGNGGELEQTLLYLEPQSAADWIATSNTAAYASSYRTVIPFDTIAGSISELIGQSSLEVNALGCGDGKTETLLVQHLSACLPNHAEIQLNLIDISHSLLNMARTHASSTLENVAVYAMHGDFHELPRFPLGQNKGRPSCRLFTMMGLTLVNLNDEVRFFRNSLSGCEPGDLFLADIATVSAPPEEPDEIRRKDPALRAKELRPSHAAWLGGPIRRHCAGATDVKFSLELDTRCPVPGSYGLDFIARVTMSEGMPDRRFLMARTRRYDPHKLADALNAVGWEPMQILTYGPDGTKSLAALLFRKR